MKRIITLVMAVFAIAYASAQSHIKFNGATFGSTVENFILGFPEKPYLQNSYADIFNKNICNGYECFLKVNAENWKCFIFSSRKTDTVFRTVCVNGWPSDLEEHLMLLVKALEEKYGGHIEEKQEDLGYISHGASYQKYKEMLALKYKVRNANNQIIGEIRISAAPWKAGSDGGCVELSYTDLAASAQATREYNSIMHNAL